jgi:hypothetical protein
MQRDFGKLGPYFLFVTGGHGMAAEELKTPAWQGTRKRLDALMHPIVLSEEERRQMIANAAYYRAERRGFVPGGELGDWLAAEREVAERLALLDARAPQSEASAASKRNATPGGTPSLQKSAAKPARKRPARRRAKE